MSISHQNNKLILYVIELSFSLNMIPNPTTCAPCFFVDLNCSLLNLGGLGCKFAGMEGLGHHEVRLVLDCDGKGDGLVSDCDGNGDALPKD